MIRAIIFDCFGVLVTDALQQMWDELQARDAAGAVEVRELVRASNKGLILPSESNQQVAKIFGLEYEEYRQKIIAGEVKNQELLDYVVSLRADYKTAMLSNIGSGSLARRFTDEELSQYFDVVVASGEIGYAKPEPEAYEITADKLAVRFDECVFTDDREEFCEAARAVGMQAICYQNFTQFRTDLEHALDSRLSSS